MSFVQALLIQMDQLATSRKKPLVDSRARRNSVAKRNIDLKRWEIRTKPPTYDDRSRSFTSSIDLHWRRKTSFEPQNLVGRPPLYRSNAVNNPSVSDTALMEARSGLFGRSEDLNVDHSGFPGPVPELHTPVHSSPSIAPPVPESQTVANPEPSTVPPRPFLYSVSSQSVISSPPPSPFPSDLHFTLDTTSATISTNNSAAPSTATSAIASSVSVSAATDRTAAASSSNNSSASPAVATTSTDASAAPSTTVSATSSSALSTTVSATSSSAPSTTVSVTSSSAPSTTVSATSSSATFTTVSVTSSSATSTIASTSALTALSTGSSASSSRVASSDRSRASADQTSAVTASQTSGVSLSSSTLTTSTQSTPTKSRSTASPSSQTTFSTRSSHSLQSIPPSAYTEKGPTSGIIGGAPASSPTSTLSSESDAGAGGSSSLNTPQVVAGCVGGIAGFAIILLIVLFLLRRHRQRLEDRSLPPEPDSSESRLGPRTSRRLSHTPLMAAMSPFKKLRPSSSQTTGTNDTGPSERGFQRLAGRKIEPVLRSGGDGYGGHYGAFEKETAQHHHHQGAGASSSSNPAIRFPDGTLFPRGDGDFSSDHGSGRSTPTGGQTRFARSYREFGEKSGGDHGRGTGSGAAPIMRPGPARSPVRMSAGPSHLAAQRPEPAMTSDAASTSRPPSIHVSDALGRSRPSQDGSRGSRFTENV